MKRTTEKEPVYEFVIKAVFLAAILTMVPPPGLLGPAQAANVDWNVNMRTVNSDNYNRLPSGLEDAGTQFTLTSGLDFAWTRGGSSYSVGGDGKILKVFFYRYGIGNTIYSSTRRRKHDHAHTMFNHCIKDFQCANDICFTIKYGRLVR